MAVTKKSKSSAWIMFLVSLVAMVLILLFAPQWFWISLPGTLTGLAIIMDWI